MKFATCNEYFAEWPIERVFDYAAELGYDGVEIAPFTLAASAYDISDGERKRIVQAADSAGVEIVGLHWLLVSPQGLYVNHEDEAIRDRTCDYFQSLIRLCGDFGGGVMIIGSPKQRAVLPDWDVDETWKRTIDVFGSCLDLAVANDTVLCIEALSSNQTNFVTTVADARRMVEEIAHPNFRTMVDVSSGSAEQVPVPQLLRDADEHLFHVHVNDANRRGPGFGETDFVSVLETLKELRYGRYVSVEVFDFDPDPQTIAAGSLSYLRGITAALDVRD